LPFAFHEVYPFSMKVGNLGDLLGFFDIFLVSPCWILKVGLNMLEFLKLNSLFFLHILNPRNKRQQGLPSPDLVAGTATPSSARTVKTSYVPWMCPGSVGGQRWGPIAGKKMGFWWSFHGIQALKAMGCSKIFQERRDGDSTNMVIFPGWMGIFPEITYGNTMVLRCLKSVFSP